MHVWAYEMTYYKGGNTYINNAQVLEIPQDLINGIMSILCSENCCFFKVEKSREWG